MSNSSPSDTVERGRLKIYLGYAAGVGKTYQMLQEARTLTRSGIDVVVGYYEPHDRPDTNALLEGLERIPCQAIEYRGATFYEMDTAAIVNRHPKIVLVDEFPHTNIPGSERGKRWEDVLYLLDHGMDVWTTVNVQHLESLNDEIYAISGVRIRETIPDWIVQGASEVVMVDLAPRALLNRLDRGAIYQGAKVQQARENFFRESTLIGLREFALRETAFEVEARQGISSVPRLRSEKILVLVTAQPETAALIRRGKRVADYFKGECIAVAVCPGAKVEGAAARDRLALEKHLRFARNLHVAAHILDGKAPAPAVVRFAHERGVTQIYIARQKRTHGGRFFGQDLVREITRLAEDLEITVVGRTV